MSNGKKILLYSTLVIAFLYFLFLGLYEAQGFLIPLVTAIILALVVLPLARKMEKKRFKRGLSSFLSTLLLFLLALAFLGLVSFQIRNFVEKWPEIRQTMKPKVEQAKSFVFEHTPLKASDLEKSGKNLPFMKDSGNNSQSSGSGSGNGADNTSSSSQIGSASQENSGSRSISEKGKKAFSFLTKTIGFIGSFLLVFIYIFFLLTYRRRFKEFLLRLFPKEKENEMTEIMYKSADVTQKYLLGKLLLSGVLAVLYAIGLGISGVNNFILVSLIAALLNILPYIGNIIGLLLALGFGYLTSGETGVLIGILITFSVAQFVETYFLEPYVVGDKVDLHPFFVILVVVIGNALWGIMGMLLAIPILAIITIVLLHIPPLHPFGFLFSKNDQKMK